MAVIQREGFLGALRALADELGEVFELKFGRFQPVVMKGPEANHFVLVEARDRLSWRPPDDPVTDLLGRGLLVTDGEEHDRLRRKLSPPLHKSRLPDYVPTMVKHTDWLLEKWSDQEVVEVTEDMRALSLRILMDTLFDVDVEPDLNRVIPWIEQAIEYISPGPWVAFRGAPRKNRASALAALDEYLYGLIRARRVRSETGTDLLSRMVEDPSMSDEMVRDQLITMLIAGHDTSTAHLAWTLHLLAEHAEHQERAHAELVAVMKGEQPTNETIDQLRLLPQICAESLRLYPPIHIGNRIANETLRYKHYEIPAGRRLVYSIYATHRDELHWPQANEFAPSRFEPGHGRQRPTYAYVPFGGGPRNCIGMAFAQRQATVVLARILQRFRIGSIQHRARLHMGATLEPAHGFELPIGRRPWPNR